MIVLYKYIQNVFIEDFFIFKYIFKKGDEKMSVSSKASIPYRIRKQNADTLTPINIFNRLTGKKRFLLESTYHHDKKGKFSFIGTDPYQEITGNGSTTTDLHHEKQTNITVNQEALAYMEKQLPKLNLDLPLPFYGGAIGYIGYDTIRTYEDIGTDLPDDLNMPDIHFMLFKNIVVFDHKNEEISLIAMNPDHETAEVLEDRLEQLNTMLTEPKNEHPIRQPKLEFQPETSKISFMEKVRMAKEHIQKGDVLQVVLSQRMKAEMEGDPFSFYRMLRKVNPSPYMFYIDFDVYTILGASPESLIQTKGKEVITNPIAGTRPRGKTQTEDDALTRELLADQKEIAEHRMLIDLSRNDLGRVCEVGSITIPICMQVEKYQHVMHIVSEVKGTLKADNTSLDALISCLPAGTVSGAPKIRAMQIINDLEEKKRGAYAGGVGYINFNRDINIALAIRSLVIKENQAYLQTGAGIVFDSIPEKEFEETMHKAKSLMEVNDLDSAH
jgi:anthranilate synthase component 1